MKNIYKLSFLLLSFSAIIFVTSRQALTKSNGSPLMNTGSPGDGSNNTCAKGGCHVGTINSFPGNVAIDISNIPAAGYSPGVTYSIGVTVTESGRNTFGFQITAEDATQNKMGDFIAGPGSRVEFTDWLTHSMNSGTGVWSVSWKAPNSSDDVTFYAAGNAANGNGNAVGDHIYTGSTTVSRNIFSSVSDITGNMGIKVYNLSEGKRLSFDIENNGNFRLYNINGQNVSSFTLMHGKSVKSFSNLKSGQYILTETNTGFSKKIVLR